MTNLNTPRISSTDPLAEAELDAAISRHFGPRRHGHRLQRRHQHRHDFGDTIPAPVVWQRQHGNVAMCSGACEDGFADCPTPDACRLPVRDRVNGARIGALIMLLSATVVVGSIAAIVAWWPK